MTSDDIGREVRRMGEQARAASHALTKLSTAEKNAILLAMAEALVAREPEILAANALDLTAATEAGLSAAMQDRLRLDSARIATMANGIACVILAMIAAMIMVAIVFISMSA